MEYNTFRWLERAGNRIGRTVRVDKTTLIASRGKFARVCVEIDLTKPLRAGYRIKGEMHELQYEGLHDLCFHCGRYGHRLSACPMKGQHNISPKEDNQEKNKPTPAKETVHGPESTKKRGEAVYGEWMTVSRPRRRITRQPAAIVGGEEVQLPSKATTATLANKGKESVSDHQGSRYIVLSEIEDVSNEASEMTDISGNHAETTAGHADDRGQTSGLNKDWALGEKPKP